jgi:hypothetical protein
MLPMIVTVIKSRVFFANRANVSSKKNAVMPTRNVNLTDELDHFEAKASGRVRSVCPEEKACGEEVIRPRQAGTSVTLFTTLL